MALQWIHIGIWHEHTLVGVKPRNGILFSELHHDGRFFPLVLRFSSGQ